MKNLAILFFALVGLASCGKWAVQDTKSKEYCIVLEADINLKLVYNTENGTETCNVGIKEEGVANGNCTALREGNPAQVLTIFYTPSGSPADQAWSLDIVYTNTSTGYKISEYKVITAPGSVCPQATGTINMLKNATNEVSASGANGFKCSKSALPLEKGSSVEFKGLRTVAFAHLNSSDFPANQGFDLCFLDTRTSDIVPIIVGACLACLVIVVLVAYLIGRARARRQGYASV